MPVKTIGSVAIIKKYNNLHATEAANNIINIFKKYGISVYSIPPLSIDGCTILTKRDLKKIDMIIAIGGDGTTLRAFRTFPSDIPVFSINIGGNKGILSEIKATSLKEINNTIIRLIQGDFIIEDKLRIFPSINGKKYPPALNDILIFRANMTRTPLISVKFRSYEMKQRMDGLIISTPIGSTGHSYSIGGPILHEDMDCIIISPIASVNKVPSLVIPSETIEIKSDDKIHFVIDGQETRMLHPDQILSISKYSSDAKFIRLNNKDMRQLEKLGF